MTRKGGGESPLQWIEPIMECITNFFLQRITPNDWTSEDLCSGYVLKRLGVPPLRYISVVRLVFERYIPTRTFLLHKFTCSEQVLADRGGQEQSKRFTYFQCAVCVYNYRTSKGYSIRKGIRTRYSAVCSHCLCLANFRQEYWHNGILFVSCKSIPLTTNCPYIVCLTLVQMTWKVTLTFPFQVGWG